MDTAAYFVVAESLTNVGKHAPGARVDVRLADRGSSVGTHIEALLPCGW